MKEFQCDKRYAEALTRIGNLQTCGLLKEEIIRTKRDHVWSSSSLQTCVTAMLHSVADFYP